MSKHRHHQIMLTLGFVIISSASVLLPEYAHHYTIIGLALNLAWLWEA